MVKNAIKFTDNGGIEINVTADKKTEDRIEISFSVKDTGIGIASHKMEAIFDRFQQVDEDTTRKYGGTGLGLSIVKQLVELQNGNINVSSKPNEGTEFIFTLPYKISKDINGKDKFMAEEEIQLNTKNIKILVAE